MLNAPGCKRKITTYRKPQVKQQKVDRDLRQRLPELHVDFRSSNCPQLIGPVGLASSTLRRWTREDRCRRAPPRTQGEVTQAHLCPALERFGEATQNGKACSVVSPKARSAKRNVSASPRARSETLVPLRCWKAFVIQLSHDTTTESGILVGRVVRYERL
jgi:hypothetical protein